MVCPYFIPEEPRIHREQEFFRSLLVAPASGDVINFNITTPDFVWNAPQTGAAVSYRLQVTTADQNIVTGPYAINVVISGTPPATQYEIQPGQELAEASYQWRVIATDAAANTGASETRLFAVDVSPPGVPTLIEPSDNAITGDSTPAFKWSAVVDPPSTGDVTYTLEIGFGTADFSNLAFTADGVQTTEFTIPDDRFLNTGDYIWHIRAVDKAGNTADSASRTFKIIPAVDLVLVAPLGVREDTTFVMPIKVVIKGGQPVATADVFLEFTTGDLSVQKIEANLNLDLVDPLVGTADNTAGTIDFSRVVFQVPIEEGEVVLAEVTFKAVVLTTGERQRQTTISFSKTGARKSDLLSGGESVLGNANPAEVTILKPTVDLRLGFQTGDGSAQFTNFDGFAFARKQVFRVHVKVELNGQNVDTVETLLDFDPRTFNALSVNRTGDGALDRTIISRIDNQTGQIDFSVATSGDPATSDFIAAVVTFQARRATQALSVGFSEEFSRRSEAAYRGASVLKSLIRFPLEIALELRMRDFSEPFNADLFIQVRPNGNRFSAIDAFVNFTTGGQGISVVGIKPGSRLEQPLASTSDNTSGTVDFSQVTFKDPPIAEFNLAVLDITAQLAVATATADFNTESPRATLVAFNGFAVPETGGQLRLLGVTMQAVPPDAPVNLKSTTPKNVNPPQFKWDPPIKRPPAGIKTFLVAIVPGTGVPATADFVDFTTSGDIVCRDVALGVIGTGSKCFSLQNVDRVAAIQFVLRDKLADGSYRIFVRAVDNRNQTGDSTAPVPFDIDTNPPSKPVLVTPNDVAFVNTLKPTLKWTNVEDPISNVFYDLEVDDNDDFSSPAAVIQTGDLPGIGGSISALVASGDGSPVLTGGKTYFWRVRSLDDAGLIPLAPNGEGLSSAAQAEAAPLVEGTKSAFTDPRSFTVDLVAPTQPGVPQRTSTGGDPTPAFIWERSKDNFAVERYVVTITRTGDGAITGTVPDKDCDPLTRLCGFTVASGDALDDDDNGSHTITVTAFDKAGNTADRSAEFLFDNQPPGKPDNPSLFALTTTEIKDATFQRMRRSNGSGPRTRVSYRPATRRTRDQV